MKFLGKKRPGSLSWSGILGLNLFCLLCLSACGGSPVLVHRYLLEYSPPAVRMSETLPVALTVEPFAVAQAFNSTAMIYRSAANVSDAYRYHRWRVDPGSMVTASLIRDFREARLFKAVLRHDSTGESRFRLEGGVEEIQEVDTPGVWQATLVLTVTLLDLEAPDVATSVVFQKTFQALEPMAEKTPAGLARAVSLAMQRLSQEILPEVYRAARQRLGSPGKSTGKAKEKGT